MSVTLSSVRFLSAGWCRQSARLAGAGLDAKGGMRFYAVFVHFVHPVHGSCLIDTGYSDEFFHATKPFPARFYRWITPVDLGDPPGPRGQLGRIGVDPDGVRHVFVSHFHADHVGGVKSFPEAGFIYRPETLARLRQQSVGTQVRHGFLRDLLPDDFETRGVPLEESRFAPGTGEWSEFSVCDYWNDGSLLLVDLPGHADGHFGFVLRTAERQLFYIVDACWILDSMLSGRRLPWISRRFQHDEAAYHATHEKLRRLTERTGLELVACHCPRTLRYVT